jgi:alpha-L-fucosidase 2
MAGLLVLCVGCHDTKTDIEYGRVNGRSLLLDAHIAHGPGLHPVVIMVHGGGWTTGDQHLEVQPLLNILNQGNFTWFSIDYRLADHGKYLWPTCLDDVNASIIWVKKHAPEYGGDPNRIALMGYSAGGQIVCYAAVTASAETRVQAIVGCAPPTDLDLDVQLRGHVLSKGLQSLTDHPKQPDPRIMHVLYTMSPVNYVTPGLPPFLIIHSKDDGGVPFQETINFTDKLKANGDPCTLIVLHGAPHDIKKWDNFAPDYGQKLIAWLNETLAAPPHTADAHPKSPAS